MGRMGELITLHLLHSNTIYYDMKDRGGRVFDREEGMADRKEEHRKCFAILDVYYDKCDKSAET